MYSKKIFPLLFSVYVYFVLFAFERFRSLYALPFKQVPSAYQTSVSEEYSQVYKFTFNEIIELNIHLHIQTFILILLCWIPFNAGRIIPVYTLFKQYFFRKLKFVSFFIEQTKHPRDYTFSDYCTNQNLKCFLLWCLCGETSLLLI